MTSATCEKNVFKSRWGFHPCNYETYLKLKEISKYYYKARAMLYDYVRWERKDPQNRIIRKWIRDDQGHKCGFEVVGPKPEPKVCPLFMRKGEDKRFWCPAYFGWDNPGSSFLEDYQNARYPKPEDQVKPLKHTPQQIDEFLAKCRAWFGE